MMPEFDRSLRGKKIVFLDLDGTVYMGDTLIPGARSFLQDLDERGILTYFLSNNSSRSKRDYVDKLRGMGITAALDRILLSTDGLIAYLQKNGIDRVYAVGTRSMLDMLHECGIETDCANPSYVVLGYDTELTYEKLRRTALLMQNGVELLATHPDLVCPTPDGPLPDVGAMLALLEKATGKSAAKVFGKPNVDMVRHILAQHGFSPEETVMIGDRLYTDMEMARRLGCDSILVLSGETRRGDLRGLTWRPSLVVENLGAILI
jgi:HAD superfamily hydrolase (TIGR01450 family)